MFDHQDMGWEEYSEMLEANQPRTVPCGACNQPFYRDEVRYFDFKDEREVGFICDPCFAETPDHEEQQKAVNKMLNGEREWTPQHVVAAQKHGATMIALFVATLFLAALLIPDGLK